MANAHKDWLAELLKVRGKAESEEWRMIVGDLGNLGNLGVKEGLQDYASRFDEIH
jgi:hypothetical protein